MYWYRYWHRYHVGTGTCIIVGIRIGPDIGIIVMVGICTRSGKAIGTSICVRMGIGTGTGTGLGIGISTGACIEGWKVVQGYAQV